MELDDILNLCKTMLRPGYLVLMLIADILLGLGIFGYVSQHYDIALPFFQQYTAVLQRYWQYVILLGVLVSIIHFVLAKRRGTTRSKGR